MFLSHLGDLIKSLFQHIGYPGVALAMAIESCLIPLPSELVMPVAGALAAAGVFGTHHTWGLIGVSLAGAIGGTIGSAIAYWIGATGGRPVILKYGKYILISRHDFDMADRAFAKHGGAIAFFSRLMPVIRTYISLPAGITRMNFNRFLIYTFLGSLPWCLVLAFAGFKLGPQAAKVGTYLHGLDYVVGAALVILVGLYIWRHIHHERAYDAKLAAQNANEPPTQKLPTIDQESTRKMPRAR